MRISSLALAAAVALCAARTAHAQPNSVPLAETRSAGVGVGLGIAGTIVPMVGFGIGMSLDDTDTKTKVVLVSLVAGTLFPAAGLAYGGRKKSIGMVPRIGAVLVVGIAALADGLGEDEESRKWYGAAGALYLVGAGIDVAMTPGAVREWNARHADSVALAPIVVPSGAGVGLAGTW